MKVKSESEVTQSCPTLSNPMDCSLPGSSIPGILQARGLEWGAIVMLPNVKGPSRQGPQTSYLNLDQSSSVAFMKYFRPYNVKYNTMNTYICST